MLLKSGQKFWVNVITKILRLSDRMTGHGTHFILFSEVSLKHVTASVLKNYVRVPQKMDRKMQFRMLPVGTQVFGCIIFVRILK